MFSCGNRNSWLVLYVRGRSEHSIYSRSGMYAFSNQESVAIMELTERYDIAGVIVCVICGLLLVWKLRWGSYRGNVPPGSVGLPIIGETFGFVQALRSDTSSAWIEKRIAKYGLIFKTSLMGTPTVIITGKEGNRLLFSNDHNTIVNKQPSTVSRIIGKYNMVEVSGEIHKTLRGAIMAFLTPEALRTYMGRMESVIQNHLIEYWKGNERVTVVPLMKRLIFDTVSSFLFRLEEGEERDNLRTDFTTALNGLWSVPLDFPGTQFRRGLNARSRIYKRLSSVIQNRRIELQQGKASPAQDLISCLLTVKIDKNVRTLSEEEIIDNLMFLMIAAHDTTAILLSSLVRLLATNSTIYQNIVQEHRDIVAPKRPGEALTWDDVQKMKYTWRVALETLRATSLVLGGFRKAVKDIQYGSYTIPKGWQLFWAACGTHMSNDIFPNADKFDPSRFDKERASIPPFSFVGFGAGPRICVGYEFAKLEILIAIHHLVTKYKWSLDIPDEPIRRDPLPCPAMGLPIRFQPIE